MAQIDNENNDKKTKIISKEERESKKNAVKKPKASKYLTDEKEKSRLFKSSEEIKDLRTRSFKERFSLTSDFGKKAKKDDEDENEDEEKKYLKDGVIHKETLFSSAITKFKNDFAFQFKNRLRSTVLYLSAVLLVIIISITGIFVMGAEINSLLKTNEKLLSENSDIDKIIFEKNMAYFSEILNDSIKKDILTKISMRYYTYMLTVNGSYVNKTTHTLAQPSATVVIRESYSETAKDLLPLDIFKLGSLFANAEDPYNIPGIEIPPDMAETKIEIAPLSDGRSFEYKITFTGIEPGRLPIIIFKDDALSKKLGLSDNKLELNYTGGSSDE